MSGQPHTFAVGSFLLTGLDEFGCFWTVSEADGWFTGSDVRTSTTSRAQQNGSWRGKSLTDGRVFTIRGAVSAPDAASLEMAGRRLSALLAHGGFEDLVGMSDAGFFSSHVQRDARPQFTPLADTRASYQVTVGSEDPLLYGEPWIGSATPASVAAGTGRVWSRAWPRDWGVPAGVTPGAVSVPNVGTATYWPRLRLDGLCTNPVIRCLETGDWIRWNATVSSGQWIDIDCGARHVTFGANSDDVRYLADASGKWLAIPPGGATLTIEADSANADTVLTVQGYEGAYE